MLNYAQMPKFQAVAIMEALMNPHHPFHNGSKELFAELQEEVHQERIAAGKAQMDQNRANMTDAEWSALVD